MHRTSLSPNASLCPLDSVDAAFLRLSSGPWPLTLPTALLSDSPQSAVMSLDHVRAWMAHPSTPDTARTRVWQEVLRRHREAGEPWGAVAVALVIPGLRRALARLPRPDELPAAELEQDVLTAVSAELAELKPDEEGAGLRLLRAGDRAAHRLVYAALRDRRRGWAPLDETVMPQPLPVSGTAGAHGVLDGAVGAGVLTELEAELIASSRLDGQSAKACAEAAGLSLRVFFRRRSAAERKLADALREEQL